MPGLTPMRFMSAAALDLRVVFISTYPPRRCGIGTYSKDLATAINNFNPDRLIEFIALDNDISESLEYPWEVSHRIRQNEWADYEQVLNYLNNSVIDLVCLQHEFGIWGGDDGELIVEFVKKLRKPFMVTFHTVLENPTQNQKRIIQEVAALAKSVVVMLPVTADILRRVYGVPYEKVVPIHHGAPDFPFYDDGLAKRELGLQDHIVMSNVNLLGRGRGIEYALEALPPVVKKYPNFLYLIIGQTHPVVVAQEGEKYRQELEERVKKLGLTKHVRFVNEYVPLEDLIRYVRASDFYITPYEEMAMTSSGSLAYAIAAGKLCISTAYLYAQEMLSGGRGYLVSPREPEAITEVLLQAIESPELATRMREKCYAQGRKMTWARVGYRYFHLMDRLMRGETKPMRIPPPRLNYLRNMTDNKGLLEHSNGDAKHHEKGYAVDDNARGLIVAVQYGDKKLAHRYLDFLVKAEVDGMMHCDMDTSGKWVDEATGGHSKPGTGDWFGRAFWATAYTMENGLTHGMRKQATELMRRIMPGAAHIKAMRAQAYVLLGLACLKEFEWDEFQEERVELLQGYISGYKRAFEKNADASWWWLEAALTYDNARMPQALLEVARVYGNAEAKKLGVQLLDFLIDETFDVRQNHFRFVGNRGWYPKDGVKAEYDEQPLEAGGMVQACSSAYLLTGMSYYRDMAKKAIAWFVGDNIIRRPLYNTKKHSVYDGIGRDGLNNNQGSENILEYLLAYSCYATLVTEGTKVSDSTYATQPE